MPSFVQHRAHRFSTSPLSPFPLHFPSQVSTISSLLLRFLRQAGIK
jgi:hypothetical protein